MTMHCCITNNAWNTSCHLIIVACASNKIYFNNNENFPIYSISITDTIHSIFKAACIVIESGIDLHVPPWTVYGPTFPRGLISSYKLQ